MKNLLTDIAGVRVGHADDAALASGVAAVMFDKPAVAAIEPAQDGRIYIELVNAAFLKAGSVPRRYRARDCIGLALAARVRDKREVHPGWR